MKFLSTLFLWLLCSLPLEASRDLKVGDILLQPLDCWACTLIEEEENTIYSHLGVVISVSPLRVAEAYRKVEDISLEEFLIKTQPGEKVLILRSKETVSFAGIEEIFHTHF